MIKYDQIRESIAHLPRREQYQTLLRTIEWLKFRMKIIDLDNSVCQICNKKGGWITAPAPVEEYKRKLEEAIQHNNQFKKKLKDPLFIEKQEKIWAGLIKEPHEGLMPYPADIIFVGEVILQVHHKLYFFNKLP